MSQAQSKKSNIEQLETRTKRADNFFCLELKEIRNCLSVSSSRCHQEKHSEDKQDDREKQKCLKN